MYKHPRNVSIKFYSIPSRGDRDIISSGTKKQTDRPSPRGDPTKGESPKRPHKIHSIKKPQNRHTVNTS